MPTKQITSYEKTVVQEAYHRDLKTAVLDAYYELCDSLDNFGIRISPVMLKDVGSKPLNEAVSLYQLSEGVFLRLNISFLSKGNDDNEGSITLRLERLEGSCVPDEFHKFARRYDLKIMEGIESLLAKR